MKFSDAKNPKHNEKPETDNSANEDFLQAKINEIRSSSYFEYLSPLRELIIGKIVLTTYAGTSGFALFFTDNSWVVAYLHNMKLAWQIGRNEPHDDLMLLMNSPEYGDGYEPLLISRPYAKEICDISAELSNAINRKIEKVAFGSSCFNFCFPDGMELDTSIVPTADGKHALRVFWERW